MNTTRYSSTTKKISYAFGIIGFCMSIFAQNPDQPKINLITIVNLLDKALEVELSRIDKKISGNMDLAQVNTLIIQELKAIKSKFAHTVKHEFTQEQHALTVQLLTDLQALSATTANDLMLMAQACSNPERLEKNNKAFGAYCAAHYGTSFDHRDMSNSERIAWFRENESIDLGDTSFNMLFKFMCQCGYVSGLHYLIRGSSSPDTQNLLEKYLYYVGEAIGTSFVVLNDGYFYPGWQEQFKKNGQIFACVNLISTQLLEVIAQQ